MPKDNLPLHLCPSCNTDFFKNLIIANKYPTQNEIILSPQNSSTARMERSLSNVLKKSKHTHRETCMISEELDN